MDNPDVTEVVGLVSSITTEALNNLLNFLSTLSFEGNDPGGMRRQDVEAIQSSVVKLEKMDERFSQQECKVIYWAIGDFRGKVSQILDTETGASDRDVLLEDFRKINAVMRFWRQFLESSEEGREVLELFK